ncbi:hypothetical protein WA158_001787 [Blastocystis sp. Blastoise]
MQAPVLVLNQNTKRESGRKVQLSNITAAKAVADIIRTTLGPRSMLKMLLDPMGGILLTNDGNAILREVDVSHPAAKSMIELSRTQDEEVGDGTTSVIILAGEMLSAAQPLLQQNIHPTVIVRAYYKALESILKHCEQIARPLDVNNKEEVTKILKSAIGTKFSARFGDLICDIAHDAINIINTVENGKRIIDIKRFVRVEKIPGGELSDSKVIRGIVVNKDVTHCDMRRRIEHPRILLMDCPLEYTKPESQANIEITDPEEFNRALLEEEEAVKRMSEDIIALKPDLVITEKGVSDLCQHYLQKAGITAIRRVRKTDNNRIAKAVGAVICHRTEEIVESDIGTGCGLFEIRKIGDEYFAFIEDCDQPKACSILLRGGSKDALNEIERNLMDVLEVCKNIMYDPRLLPGGGATEMELSCRISKEGASMGGIDALPYIAVGKALECIPRTLCENCGGDVIRTMTSLRAKHSKSGNEAIGVDGIKGTEVDMFSINIFDTYQVKTQTIKTAVESACMLLRIDDIVSSAPSQ